MNVKSVYRFARISAFKAREVTKEIQGLPATDAMDMLKFVPRKAAGLVRKTLASAIANAENNNNLNAEDLTIREAVVGEGPTFKRYRPRARGSAGQIRKRTSHISIIVTDELEIVRRDSTTKKKGKKASSKKGSSTPKAKTPVEPKADAPTTTATEAAPSNPEATPASEATETKS